MIAVRGRIAMVAASAAVLAGAAPAQQSIHPGYWESLEQVRSPIDSTVTNRRCITPKDVAKFMSCHINHHFECACPHQTVGGGRIAFKGQCVDNKGQRVNIAGTGDFTATTLHLTAHASFELLGLPVDAEASTDAHRIGDTCPPGSSGGPASDASPETFR